MKFLAHAALFFALGVVGRTAADLAPGHAIRDSAVVDVLSGDTVVLSIEDQKVKVHLHGIAAPHLDQPGGVRAKEELRKFALNKRGELIVDVVISREEVAGILFCQTTANSSTNANIEMVRRGWAWYDVRSGLVKKDANPPSYRNMDLIDFEEEARKARRGLWADKSPIPPWDWQKTKEGAKR